MVPPASGNTQMRQVDARVNAEAKFELKYIGGSCWLIQYRRYCLVNKSSFELSKCFFMLFFNLFAHKINWRNQLVRTVPEVLIS
jgi:hypothetical protein